VTLYFWQEGYHDNYLEGFEFKGDPEDLVFSAEEFSEIYHNEHDGWESGWPITWAISDENGTLLGRVIVERESIPTFYGAIVREERKL
jgi:hypothetical protein